MNGLIEPQLIMANKDADDSEDEIVKLGENQRCKHDGESGVKKEPEEESDIQNFAETTMNELLGWYGYDKVDSRDTQSLRLTVHRFTGKNGQDRCGKSSSSNNTPPTSPHSNENSSSSDVANGVDDSFVSCSWCKKVGSKLYTLQTHNGTKTFCSETCFNQCRRASFKKYKICDWCKHVRHTVNYVDFQDGEQQLQFCSDKCLNQYKMHIFCKEAQAHLQMHQHLSQQNSKKPEVGKLSKSAHTLITPEMWMRDCKDDSLSDGNQAEVEAEVREKEQIVEKTSNDSVRTSKPTSGLHFAGSGERRRRLHRAKDRERRHNRRELPVPGADVGHKNDVSKRFGESLDPIHRSTGNGPFPSPNCSTSNVNNSNLRLPSLTDTPTQAPPPPPSPAPRFPLFMHGMAPPTTNFGFNFPRNFLMDQIPPFLPRPPPPLPPSLTSGNLLPPPTLMIPYPVMLPVPVPVPIPIPLPIRECDWKQLMSRKGLLPSEQDIGDVSDKSFASDRKSSSSVGSSCDSVTSGGEVSKSAESEPEVEERKGRVEQDRKRAVGGDGESKRKCLRTRLSAK